MELTAALFFVIAVRSKAKPTIAADQDFRHGFRYRAGVVDGADWLCQRAASIFLIIGGFALLAAGGLGRAAARRARCAGDWFSIEPFGGYCALGRWPRVLAVLRGLALLAIRPRCRCARQWSLWPDAPRRRLRAAACSISRSPRRRRASLSRRGDDRGSIRRASWTHWLMAQAARPRLRLPLIAVDPCQRRDWACGQGRARALSARISIETDAARLGGRARIVRHHDARLRVPHARRLPRHCRLRFQFQRSGRRCPACCAPCKSQSLWRRWMLGHRRARTVRHSALFEIIEAVCAPHPRAETGAGRAGANRAPTCRNRPRSASG